MRSLFFFFLSTFGNQLILITKIQNLKPYDMCNMRIKALPTVQ